MHSQLDSLPKFEQSLTHEKARVSELKQKIKGYNKSTMVMQMIRAIIIFWNLKKVTHFVKWVSFQDFSDIVDVHITLFVV